MWLESGYADQYFRRERDFLNAGLRQAIGPSTLQIGDMIDFSVVEALELPYLVRSNTDPSKLSDVVADPAFLPFASDSLATVILPHALEGHTLPHQVLREAHRVLVSEGHIVLTGFNPMSIMGLQSLIHKRAVYNGKYYAPSRVIDWLQLLGCEVVASSMFQYAQLSTNQRFRGMFKFLESVGERWLPMFGGGYMIVAKKRDAGVTMVGKLRFKTPKSKIAAPVTAQAANEKQPAGRS